MINYQQIGEEAFRNADKNRLGHINLEQLQSLVAVVAAQYDVETPAPEEIQTIINNYDDNNDGVMQLEEFMKFFEDIFCVNGLQSPLKRRKNKDSSKNLQQTNNLISSIRNRSTTDGKIFSQQNQQLRRRSIRMCRVSGILNTQMSKMKDEILLADIPKGIKDKKAWLESRRHADENFLQYQQRLNYDKKYVQSCRVIRDPKTNITTVVADLQPQKRSSQHDISIMGTHHDFTTKSSKSRHTKTQSEDFTSNLPRIHKKSWEDQKTIQSSKNINSKYQSQKLLQCMEEPEDNIDYMEIMKTFSRPKQGGFRSVYQSRNTSQGKIQQNMSKRSAHYAMKQRRKDKAQTLAKLNNQ